MQRVGRPLEQAQLKYYFGDVTVNEVLGELSKFQNDDGGFGHAMELDIRMPNSSPLCSSVAFQVLRELEVSDDLEIVHSAIGYRLSAISQIRTSRKLAVGIRPGLTYTITIGRVGGTTRRSRVD